MPVKVEGGLAGKRVLDFDCGKSHFAAVTGERVHHERAYARTPCTCWRPRPRALTGRPTPPVADDAIWNLYTWGSNTHGQLGLGHTGEYAAGCRVRGDGFVLTLGVSPLQTSCPPPPLCRLCCTRWSKLHWATRSRWCSLEVATSWGAGTGVLDSWGSWERVRRAREAHTSAHSCVRTRLRAGPVLSFTPIPSLSTTTSAQTPLRPPQDLLRVRNQYLRVKNRGLAVGTGFGAAGVDEVAEGRAVDGLRRKFLEHSGCVGSCLAAQGRTHARTRTRTHTRTRGAVSQALPHRCQRHVGLRLDDLSRARDCAAAAALAAQGADVGRRNGRFRGGADGRGVCARAHCTCA